MLMMTNLPSNKTVITSAGKGDKAPGEDEGALPLWAGFAWILDSAGPRQQTVSAELGRREVANARMHCLISSS